MPVFVESPETNPYGWALSYSSAYRSVNTANSTTAAGAYSQFELFSNDVGITSYTASARISNTKTDMDQFDQSGESAGITYEDYTGSSMSYTEQGYSRYATFSSVEYALDTTSLDGTSTIEYTVPATSNSTYSTSETTSTETSSSTYVEITDQGSYIAGTINTAAGGARVRTSLGESTYAEWTTCTSSSAASRGTSTFSSSYNTVSSSAGSYDVPVVSAYDGHTTVINTQLLPFNRIAVVVSMIPMNNEWLWIPLDLATTDIHFMEEIATSYISGSVAYPRTPVRITRAVTQLGATNSTSFYGTQLSPNTTTFALRDTSFYTITTTVAYSYTRSSLITDSEGETTTTEVSVGLPDSVGNATSTIETQLATSFTYEGYRASIQVEANTDEVLEFTNYVMTTLTGVLEFSSNHIVPVPLYNEDGDLVGFTTVEEAEGYSHTYTYRSVAPDFLVYVSTAPTATNSTANGSSFSEQSSGSFFSDTESVYKGFIPYPVDPARFQAGIPIVPPGVKAYNETTHTRIYEQVTIDGQPFEIPATFSLVQRDGIYAPIIVPTQITKDGWRYSISTQSGSNNLATTVLATRMATATTATAVQTFSGVISEKNAITRRPMSVLAGGGYGKWGGRYPDDREGFGAFPRGLYEKFTVGESTVAAAHDRFQPDVETFSQKSSYRAAIGYPGYKVFGSAGAEYTVFEVHEDE